MATNITKLKREKRKIDTINALKTVLKIIEDSVEVSDANFWSNSEYDETVKDDNVWIIKYPNGWHNLSIELRYLVQNTGEKNDI